MQTFRLTIAILSVCSACCILFVRCAPGASTRSGPSVSIRPDSASHALPAARSTLGDTLVDAGSFIDKYGFPAENSPECPEIEYLLESAKTACKADSFAEAHAHLQKALRIIRQKAEDDKTWADTETFSRTAAALYADNMPEEYSDSIPDEISMLVFQKQLSRSLDTLKLSETDSTVLKKLSCQKGISYNFPITWNDRVYRSISFFARRGKGSLDKFLERTAYYQPFMQRMFADSGLPTDLSYLPLVESGFDPNAYSRRHASGIWQFIAPTGAKFSLRNNYWLDERRDPVKSTGAAISYFRKLYNQFGDWSLAIAAYNCGENGVTGAIAKSSSGNYWRLSLPRETKNYVPEFISALIVAKNPECFGYSISRRDTFDLDAVFIDECVNLQAVADSLGIPGQNLHSLNPHILHWCTPPSLTGVRLYLPKGKGARFEQLMERRPAALRVSWYDYRANQGDNLAVISRMFKVPLDATVSLNGLGTGCRIAKGQKILIPIPVHMSTDQAYEIARDLARSQPRVNVQSGRGGTIRYQARSGETIHDLAGLFNVSEEDICRWNNLTSRRINAGQFLTIRLEPSAPAISQSANAGAGAPQGNSPFAKYQVHRGETLFSIARTLSVSVSDLISWNGMDPNNPAIFSGQNISYKPGHRSTVRFREPDTLFYRVCKGDNLHSLAASFSVSVASLRRANSLSPESVIKQGDLIKIPYVKKLPLKESKLNRAPAMAQEEHL
jgi:membrane-bound lytic murein transglycosylase D